MQDAFISTVDDGDTLNILGTDTRFVCPGERTGQSWSLMEVTLPLDSGAPSHEHPWDEAYYVLSGEVRFSVGGQRHLLSAGDFLYAPANTVHAFHGHSNDPARMLVFDAPAHAEDFFREVDAEVKILPQDLGKMPSIGARHQVKFHP